MVYATLEEHEQFQTDEPWVVVSETLYDELATCMYNVLLIFRISSEHNCKVVEDIVKIIGTKEFNRELIQSTCASCIIQYNYSA